CKRDRKVFENLTDICYKKKIDTISFPELKSVFTFLVFFLNLFGNIVGKKIEKIIKKKTIFSHRTKDINQLVVHYRDYEGSFLSYIFGTYLTVVNFGQFCERIEEKTVYNTRKTEERTEIVLNGPPIVSSSESQKITTSKIDLSKQSLLLTNSHGRQDDAEEPKSKL
ncbi:hypothetical protein RFI_35435, partial [Reticulomyxa filosa]